MSSPNRIHPVFYDENRRRWPWILRLGLTALFVASVALAGFLLSILAIPLLPHNALPRAREIRDVGNPDNPALTQHQKARHQFVFRRDKRLLEQERNQERAERLARQRAVAAANRTGKGGAAAIAATTLNGPTIVAGFYVNWEETSKASLHRNIDQLTHFIPEWLHLNRDGKTIADGRIPEDRTDVDPFVRAHNIPILPLINNWVPKAPGSEENEWDKEAVHKLLSNPENRTAFITNLKELVLRERWQGVNIDLEEIPVEDRDNLTELMRELYASFQASKLLVTQDVQLDVDSFDIPGLAQYNDYILPMLYDQHSPNDENGTGSVAGIDWTRERLKELFKSVPPQKMVLALGNYAYDWQKGSNDAASLSYQAAVIQAKESRDPKDPAIGRIQIDPKTLNPTYRYFDDAGKEHTVWMMDATTTYNQWLVARPYAPRGYALWYLGSEDPSLWNMMGRSHIGGSQAALAKQVQNGVFNDLTYGRQSQVDFEGEGEMLDVVAKPNEGRRTVTVDPKTSLITAQEYSEYPSSYVVRRYGYKPKQIVLTFDDGPDPTWTPKILDVLKREGVKATFFVIGQQAESNPGLIARIWEEGHELGNHTFTHPNLALTGRERSLLEITTTQRIIEAITGHTTTLFRPPYAIDVEPRTGGELRPIMLASEFNFISLGEKNDPQDWNLTERSLSGKTGAERILESAWNDRDAGSVILLHDGGGDRSATVAALPQIIEKFKAAGYKFITTAELRGVSRAALFPPVTGREQALVGVDKYVFETTYFFQCLMVLLFTLSVVLGITRQFWMTGLALVQRRRERARERVLATTAGDYRPVVSVIIAAYNEENVIERTIRSVLASDYPKLEILVVDDGSKDGTFEVASTLFAGDPRVACIRKENGGKSSALNLGLTQAQGEVIVALDADTLFTPETIGRLVRHFVAPRVGAVSGNVRVGNTKNLLTRWQALEYITSQNFDRRAYDLMNCITVVPGAVGAWRRIAIEQVGGYTHDTLAEDTDLTWKIRRAGWYILNDSTAFAYTEAPESLRNLSRQRFRWAFGTLQNLWKHRKALGRYGAFGGVALPSLWLYQILFPAISPIMDLAVLFALFMGNGTRVLTYYAVMVGAEFLGAVIAICMDRGNPRLLPWLFLQRLVYRQLMYYVILKSFVAAIHGGAVGWNKFERTGTAQMDGEPAAGKKTAPDIR